MGGTDDPNNLIELTVEQHALAHKKLYEKYGHWEDKLAWQGLSGQIGKEEIIQEIYKNRKGNLGNHHSEKSKQKMRNKMIGRKLTPEHIAKTRRTGRPQTEYQKKTVAEKLSKEYIITGAKGEIYEVKNLRKWAIEKGLDQGNLTKVAQGKLRRHKGYKIQYK